jgi:hypothetical protein
MARNGAVWRVPLHPETGDFQDETCKSEVPSGSNCMRNSVCGQQSTNGSRRAGRSKDVALLAGGTALLQSAQISSKGRSKKCVEASWTAQPHQQAEKASHGQGNVSCYTAVPMKRPCGLRFGPACGTLFVACMDPAIMRFAGIVNTCGRVSVLMVCSCVCGGEHSLGAQMC